VAKYSIHICKSEEGFKDGFTFWCYTRVSNNPMILCWDAFIGLCSSIREAFRDY